MAKIACGVSRIDCPTDVMMEATIAASGAPETSLSNGAWCVVNWNSVLDVPVRGGDLEVPGVDYVLPRKRYLDMIGPVSLQMVFDGNVDEGGGSHAPNTLDHGLELNRRTFVNNAVNPPIGNNNLFTLSLTLLDGTVLAADCHVEGFQWNRRHEGFALAAWQITLPRGFT